MPALHQSQSHTFARQTSELVKKNLRLQARNRLATCAQLFVGVFFLILLGLMDTAIKGLSSANSIYTDTTSPPVEQARWRPILPCDVSDTSKACYHFVYAPMNPVGVDRPRLEAVVDQIRAILDIPESQTKYFGSSQDASTFLELNESSALAAIYFGEKVTSNASLSGTVSYVLQINETEICASLGTFECNKPKLEVSLPLQLAIDSALLRVFGDKPEAHINASFSDFPHPDLPNSFDVLRSYGSSFFYIAISFNYVIQLVLIVEEKEAHLIESMDQMGLNFAAYWLSWFLVDTLVNTIMVLLILIVGYIMNFELFLETPPGLLLSFFWLSSMAFTGLAFFFSTLTSKSSTARLLGIGCFVVTFIASPLLVSFVVLDGSPDFDTFRAIFTLLPPIAFYQVISELIESSAGVTQTGTEWKEISVNLLEADESGVGFWSIESSLYALVQSFFLFAVLTWYFDHVFKGRSLVFCVNPSFWIGTKGTPDSKDRLRVHPEEVLGEEVDEDVKAEMVTVQGRTYGSRDIAVEVVFLNKVFKSGWLLPQTFEAVKHITYSIDKESIFVLLGHNGAGKSTTIHMLTGLTSVTGGDAHILGLSVKHDMPQIKKIMGVCPQHDVLWSQLSGREHLEMFARIKGVDESTVAATVQQLLDDVLLTDAGDVPAGKYSGGMRRRLSLAIALIGDPKIVYLDEPTTGMDPVTRKQVWDVICKARKGRVIVLTTHSMEEAEILGDRIAVMSHGKLQAIGSSLELKSKYGSGYHMNAFLKDESSPTAVIEYFRKNAPDGSQHLSTTGNCVQFQFPKEQDAPSVDLGSFFETFEQNMEDLQVADYSIGMATLEEVFLNLSTMDGFAKNDAEKKAESDGAVEGQKSSVSMQLKALFLKSLSYQLSQKTSCCIIVTLPVLIMGMLFAIEAFLFEPLTVEALCGAVPKANCQAEGPDVDCLIRLQSMSFPMPVTFDMGVIKRGGRFGGVNPNCDENGCFTDLEKPNYTSIPFHDRTNGRVDGNLSSSTSSEVQEWRADLLFLLGDTSCKVDFDTKLNAQATCKDKTGKAFKNCVDDVQELKRTRTHLNQNDTGVCLGSSASTYVPPAASVALVEQYEAVLEECERLRELTLLNHFSNLSSALGNVSFQQKEGILGRFTTRLFPDEALNEFLAQVAKKVFPAAQSAAAVEYIETICSTPVLKMQLQNYSIEGLCLFVSKMDLIRGLSFEQTASPNLLRERIYSNWYGYELETERTRTARLPTSMLYLQRQFYAHWQAYEMVSANSAAARYEYTGFYNNSGSGNTEHGNWQILTLGMNNAIFSHHTNLSLQVYTQRFPRKLQCNRDEWLAGDEALDCDLLPPVLKLSIVDFVALTLFPYLLMLQIFIVVALIVYEKENKLRLIMRMMGLGTTIYWVVNFLFYLTQYAIMVAFLWVVGAASGLQMFTLHDASVLFLFFGLWGVLMVLFSFLLSVLFKSSRTSNSAIFLFILIVNTTGTNLLEAILSDSNSTELTVLPLMWLPPLVMIRALQWLSVSAALNEGLTFANMPDALVASFGYMIGEILLTGILLWYLDKVVVVGYGTSEHPLFFLRRSFWFPSKAKSKQEDLKSIREVSGYEAKAEKDLTAEYERAVKGGDQVVGQIIRIHKRFSNKVAVRSVSLGLNENECFGLLGHNGAGKTTLISMLCGLFPPTKGDAVVHGHSILSHMASIYSFMGVCPQHDVLWDSLNARVHLRFFGRLKGLSGSKLKQAVEAALEKVNLTYAAHRRVGSYSGGMKRRLSVAISFMGDPSVVYLDEPSTGLDPASRRQLWTMILRAKANKTLILTTHSMEEAEVLCDRLGIMSHGQLLCIGNAAELKRRYGKGYNLFLGVDVSKSPEEKEVVAFVQSELPSAVLLQEPIGGMFKFEVDRKDVTLSRVFAQMKRAKESINLKHWGITETTLEEVFIKLAHDYK